MADTSLPGSAAEHRKEAQAEEHEIAKGARAGGAPAFEFNANTSPADKAAVAKKAIPQGLDLSMAKDLIKPAGAAVASDTGDAPATEVMPTAGRAATNGTNGSTGGTNGALVSPKSPTAPATSPTINGFPKAGDGEWSRTGWSPRFGSLNDALTIDDHNAGDHQTWVEGQLDEKFFGEWWHNAGIIAFACLSTWLLTLIGGGLGWVCIVGATCATYYRTSVRRVRRNVRDDLNREMAKNRLDSDVETLEWLNSFVVKFWPIYQPVLAATIINTVDQVLVNATPAFLDSLRLTTFTLGTKPPRIEYVKTYPKTEDDVVEMDWSFSFTPNDTADLTSRQLKNKINPKIVLEVRIGKGIASKGIPIVLEDMAFSGTMKVKIKLQINFPHIEKVDVCFLGRPTFDYALKPLGGETFGFDIGFLPGLSGFIQEQIHGNLGPMLYAPNVFTVEVAKILGGTPIDTAVGVLAVTIHRAHGLKNPDKFSGTPDPYVAFSINRHAELARTEIVHESADPKWNETKYIILSNLNDSLDMQVFDYNEIRKDKELGVASFGLDKLQEDPEQENLSLPVLSNSKPRGQIMFDVRYFPVLEGRTLEDGTKEPAPESNSGVVRYTISQAKDLDHSKSMVGQLSPYAQMLLNGQTVFTTKTLKRTNNPIWEESHEMLITNRNTCKLGVAIKDERGFADDPSVGKYQIKLTDLLEGGEKGNDWFNLVGVRSGRVKMSAQWKPVALKGVVGTGGYVTPIGVMRLHFQSATNLRNLETMGKSDPYVRVLLSGVAKARTMTFENDLNPSWDEVLYISVHSAKEKLTLEVMDQEGLGRDRSLGAVELALSEFVHEDEQGLFQAHDDKRNRSDGLIQGHKGAPKGTLNYTAAFYPCLNIADPEEEEEKKKLSEQDNEEPSKGGSTDETSSEGGNEKRPNVADAPKTPLSPAFTLTSEDDEKKPPKLQLTPEELISHESGLLVFKIIDGQIAYRDCYLEVLMDDLAHPVFSTAKIRSRSMKFDDIGDAMVRELDFSKVILRLREHGGEDEDGVLASLSGSTLETLKLCMNNPTALTLKGKDGELSKINVSLRYIPILMKLDPSESINNMGALRVDILDAANLPSADRNGKSDPYCVFELDGKEIHKTKVQKKTLHPAWNEVFETKVASRTAAKFTVEIFDWDIGTKADFLAKTDIDLNVLESFSPQTIVLKLKGKHGEEGKFGELRLRMVFKPDYVARSHQGSSTFHGNFAAPGKLVTGVAGAPLKVGGFAVGGISKGASFLKKNTFGRRSRDTNVLEEEQPMAADPDMERMPANATVNRPMSGGSAIRPSTDGIDDANNSQLLTPSRTTDRRSTSLSPNAASGGSHLRSRSVSSQHSVHGSGVGAEAGTATVRLVSASGFPTPANVQIRIKPVGKSRDVLKSKSIKAASGECSWNDESFAIECFADQQFKIFAKDNHIFKDEELGEGLFVVNDTGSDRDTVVQVGQGTVTLKTSFFNTETASTTSPKHRRNLLKRVV